MRALPGAVYRRPVRVDEANTARVARPLRLRRRPAATAIPWSRSRIAGETVLAVVLAGLAGLFDAVGAGFGVRTVAVVAGVALLSLLRRARPATVLVVSAAAAGAWIAAVPLLLYASWSAGSRIMRPRRVVATYAAALVLHTAASARNELTADPGLSLSAAGALGAGVFLALAIVPGLAARYRAQRHALLDALQRNNVQLVREQTMVAQQARLLERGRIAQDMHDSLGHQLALISVHAGALQVDPDLTDRQREGVRILRDASVHAMAELREAVGILHEDRDDRDRTDHRTGHVGKAGQPPGAAADTDGGQPRSRSVASLDGLVESSRAVGATVELHRSGAVRPLAPAADHAAYRIAQEGLTNAHKHAPGAPITLALRYEPDSLVVEVANGPAPAGPPEAPAAVSGGQGLRGLHERAQLVGGMVHAGPTADGGFRIAGMLPYGNGGGESRPRPDDATSVYPDDDFGGQPGAGAADHSRAVINRADPQGEFAATMSSKKNVAIGCAVTAVVLVVGVIALAVWGVNALLDEVDKATIPPGVYERAKTGAPEADVQDELPAEDSVLTEDYKNMGPRSPEGATCRHFGSDDPDDTTTIFRFCFRDGKLVAKQTFQDKS
ncbi:sensor histidine kinase [Streptomyces shenzhenensis]|uniref:histidine kinase n=1 Tax=Streptomyces shenzhenensis TaxID=943815 RepID=A0A3M0IRZ9_9ACTN|nr:histidine kinase [Streptomyces shenzhenensis]RMB84906.1 two-component sensor histidine kinase [Streptomyces shenzhenensis]